MTVELSVGTITVKWGFISELTVHTKEVTQMVVGQTVTANCSIVLYAAHSPQRVETDI